MKPSTPSTSDIKESSAIPAIAKESPSFGLFKGGENQKKEEEGPFKKPADTTEPAPTSLFSAPKKQDAVQIAAPSSSGSLFGAPKEKP
jgi:hypothetical protein